MTFGNRRWLKSFEFVLTIVRLKFDFAIWKAKFRQFDRDQSAACIGVNDMHLLSKTADG